MSYATLKSLAAAASAALLAGNYDTAIRNAMAALPLVGAMPDTGNAGESVAWRNAGEIREFIAQCRQLKASAAASAGFVRQSVTYERAAEIDE